MKYRSIYEEEIACQSMCESIVCYGGRQWEYEKNNSYLENYIETLGMHTVKRIYEYVYDNIDEISYAGTDYEGVTYNSNKYKKGYESSDLKLSKHEDKMQPLVDQFIKEFNLDNYKNYIIDQNDNSKLIPSAFFSGECEFDINIARKKLSMERYKIK